MDSDEFSDSNSFKVDSLLDLEAGPQAEAAPKHCFNSETMVSDPNIREATCARPGNPLSPLLTASKTKPSSEPDLLFERSGHTLESKRMEPRELESPVVFTTTFLRPSFKDMDSVRCFANYFPQGNVTEFLGRYLQARRLLLRKGAQRKKRKAGRQTNRRTGYGVFSCGFEEPSSFSQAVESGPSSSPPAGFFSVLQSPKRLNFLELVREARGLPKAKKKSPSGGRKLRLLRLIGGKGRPKK